jgi:serine/threonine protein kinase
MKIFVSYRRGDRPKIVGHVVDRLRLKFGRDSVFQDVDSIDLGENFYNKLQKALDSADLLLAVIGPDWLPVENPNRPGERRIDDPDDFVRVELREALKRRNVRVLPLRVDGAGMPTEDELPIGLKALSRRQCRVLRKGPRFDSDLNELVEGIEAGAYETTPDRPHKAGRGERGNLSDAARMPPKTSSEDVLTELETILEDHYKIEDLVSEGDRFLIFRAVDTRLDRRVGIKVLDTSQISERDKEVALRAFDKAIGQAGKLRHPNILQVYDGQPQGRFPYLVRDFVDGLTLDKIVKATGVQSFRKVCHFLDKIGDALSYAHRSQFVHLNLRPSNILVDKYGEPIISPFRFRNLKDGVQRESYPTPEEDRAYLSPEQFDQNTFPRLSKRVASLSDQYQLGLVAYEMIIGRPVIEPRLSPADRLNEKERFMSLTPDPRVERPDCPDELAGAVMRMLKTNPEDRFARLNDVRDAVVDINFDETLYCDPSEVERFRWAMNYARSSYLRCRETESFFAEFYKEFFRLNPETEQQFRDRTRQYYALRETIDLILQFPTENPNGTKTTLSRVAESHKNRKIGQKLYDSFTTTLYKTVLHFDPDCDSLAEVRATLDAWERLLKPAVEFMLRA